MTALSNFLFTTIISDVAFLCVINPVLLIKSIFLYHVPYDNHCAIERTALLVFGVCEKENF